MKPPRAVEPIRAVQRRGLRVALVRREARGKLHGHAETPSGSVVVAISARIDEDVYRAIRIAGVRRGLTMATILEAALRDWLRDHGEG